MDYLEAIQARLVQQRAKLEKSQQRLLSLRGSAGGRYSAASKVELIAEEKGRVTVLLEEVSWLQMVEEDLLRQQQVEGLTNIQHGTMIAFPGGLDK